MSPDRSKTFGDLLLDLSEELALVRRAPNAAEIASGADPLDNTRRLPDDPATLERVKRAANDGAKDFDRAIKAGWQRPKLDITLSATATPLNIADDVSRIRLDRRVISVPQGEVSWSLPGSTNRYGITICTHIDRVDQAQKRDPNLLGPPRLCCVRPVSGESLPLGERQGYELVVFPTPDAAYVISARFRMNAYPMVQESERPTWPEVHDRTWLAFAVCAFYGRNVSAGAVAVKDQALAESREVEGEMKPRTLGRLGGGTASPLRRAATSIIDVDGNVLVP